MLKRIDDVTAYIQKQLKQMKLDKRVNVVHLSDHGMTSVTPPHFIYLNEILTKINCSCQVIASSPQAQIIPNDLCEYSTFTVVESSDESSN